jgi:di/tricarboxylate transporter
MSGFTFQQLAAIGIVLTMLVLFVWDRWRYDLVAMSALLAALVLGTVEPDDAFEGFADPVIVTIAAVLVASRAVARSGILDRAVQRLLAQVNEPSLQIGVLATAVGLMSAFIKNVGTLGIFIPIAIQVARRSRQSPSIYLMPLAFASLIGGTITQIGTSPNLLISTVRQDLGGPPFGMFDYAWVGLPLTLLAVVFLAFGWRLLPKDRRGRPSAAERFDPGSYTIELAVGPQSPFAGKTVGDLEAAAKGDLVVTSVARGGTRNRIPNQQWPLMAGDVVTVQADPQPLKAIVSAIGLDIVHAEDTNRPAEEGASETTTVEVIVAAGSPLVGETAQSVRLRQTYNVNFLAVSRAGRRIDRELRTHVFEIGDIIVLQGLEGSMAAAIGDLKLLPLADRSLDLATPSRGAVSLAVLAVAMVLVAFKIAPVGVAFFGAAVAIVWLRQITLRDAYDAIEGPVLVMLAVLIPIARSLERTGVTKIAGDALASLGSALPGEAAVAMMLAAAMIATPFLNNAAAVLMLGPLAGAVAGGLGYKPEPFLMAVALGCACDFMTPIGHQNNLLVMGPGGYRFGDYWRLGLPLSLMILILGTMLILAAWPLR